MISESFSTASQLRAALDRLAAVEVLLVACDFDGTLAELTPDPLQTRPRADAVAALRQLAQLPQTPIALISGRALVDLERLSGLGEIATLIGSHGWEAQHWKQPLAAAEQRIHDQVVGAARQVAAQFPGIVIEIKPATVAVHYRAVAAELRDAAIAGIKQGPAAVTGAVSLNGKEVVEVAVVETNKGSALRRLRAEVQASAVLFLGDDTTDEFAFAVLHDQDVGIKVGAGATQASYRIPDPTAVATQLSYLGSRRG